MNTWSVVWTVLPNGIAPPDAVAPSVPGRARLSLLPTIRVVTDAGTLREPEVLRWAERIAGVRTVTLRLAGPDGVATGTVVSPPPDQRLWAALFGPDTPVEPPVDEGPIFVPVITSVHTGPVRAALDRVYDQALAGSPTAPLPAGHPALRTVRGLAEWTGASSRLRSAVPAPVRDEVDRLLEPAALTAGRIDEAVRLLRGAGQDAAADALPLALVARRLAATGAGPAVDGAAKPPAAPSHVKGIRPVEQADFHQVAGLVSDHPALALALGLRVDVEIDAFAGDRTVRLVSEGTPLQGGVLANQPWSRVSAAPALGRFLMAARDAGSEVADGTVDLSPPGKYVTTTADLVGQSEQLRALAGTLASADPPATVGLPTRRNTGITLAQVDRRATTVAPSLAQSTLIGTQLGVPGTDVVLFADDVTTGYRIDVSVDGGRFRSLMHRQITYSVNPKDTKDPFVRTAADEGSVEALTMAEQYDQDGRPQLSVGEQLFAFDGWSMVVPKPGRRITGETAGGGGVGDPEPGMAPGYPLSMRVAPAPGTVTPLRYGRTYRFQARAVDLAGNSIAPAAAHPAAASEPVPYLRLDPVLPPVRVPRAPFSFGESLDRLVVRTDDGTPVDSRGRPTAAPGERHLAAPKTTQALAETHGAFDAGFGPRATQADRDRQYAIARTEEGVFTDLTVPDPVDPARRRPADGIAVVRNDGALPPPKGLLPIRRGQALPAGTYVVHDTDTLFLPYLADVPAAGAALTGLPGTSGPTLLPYGGDRWPDVRPARLRLHPGKTGGTVVGTVGDRSVLDVTLPPAAEVVTEVSSTLRPGAVEQFQLPPGADLRKAATAGQVPLVSPRDRIVLVHAVRKPLLPLAVTAATPAARAVGSTSVSVTGSVTCHPASTVRLDVEAVWTEPLDDGTSPVTDVHRSSTAEHLTVPVDRADLPWSVTQHFGDTRRRDVRFRVIGTTRFREYFAPVPDGDPALTRTGDGPVVVVPNSARPEPPVVHSVLPLFRWVRTFQDGRLESRRQPVGFRVWLDRPWMQTGTGETLGVVVFDGTKGPAVMQAGHRLGRLVTRWGSDPMEPLDPGGPPMTLNSLSLAAPDGSARPVLTAVSLLDSGAAAGVGAGAAAVVGHQVRYDADRDLWYADVELGLPEVRFPFVRLGLVRYQPESVPGCHLSRVVTPDLVQFPPPRTLQIVRGEDSGQSLRLTVFGPRMANTTYAATLTRTQPGSLDGTAVVEDLLLDAPFVSAPLPAPPPGSSNVVAIGHLPMAQLPTGCHLVVTESQRGDNLHTSPLAGRTTWFDVVDRGQLAQVLSG